MEKCISESKKPVRNSGIECLKIAAIILIVVSHVVQTLSDKNTFIQYHDYLLDLLRATCSIQKLILSILEYSGLLGNTIFLFVQHGLCTVKVLI